MTVALPSLFLLAGPQCAGKSAVRNYLFARYMVQQTASQPFPQRNLVLLQEMRQLVMHEHGVHSAIFIDASLEEEIIRRDLHRLEMIVQSREQLVYVDETGPFTLAHARRHGIGIGDALERYRQYLTGLGAAILFLDIPPSISWARRKSRYEERLFGFPPDEAAVVLARYREYLESVYGGLLEVIDLLGLPTLRVDASGAIEDTLRSCARGFEELATQRTITLVPRF